MLDKYHQSLQLVDKHLQELKALTVDNSAYHKCGVQLSHMQPESAPGQMELFDFADHFLPTDNRPLMKVVDQINRCFPRAISMAATGFDKAWKPKAERVSQQYTTDWRELVMVK